MHQVTIRNHKIKIQFDKNIQGWIYTKEDIKYMVESYFDKMSILYLPTSLDNLSSLFKKYVNNEEFNFDDKFSDYLEKEINNTEKFELKRKLLKERVTLSSIESRLPLIEHKEPAPFLHQRVHLEYAVRFPGFYNLDEMGLGKTRVAIERYWFLKEKLGVVDKCIVICPLSLVYNWANEIKKWSDCKSLILTGSKKQKIEEIMMFKDQVDFFIMNYEGIESIKVELMRFFNGRTNIILDEFIKIKNASTRRSGNTVNICNRTEYVYAMCGTPITQGSPDVFSPSLAVDKGKKYGLSQQRFIDKYFWRYGHSLQAKRGTYDELSEKLYQNALRFTKKECLDIPEKLYTSIPIDLPKENKEAYEQMAAYCLAYINEKEEITAPIMLVQLLRLSQITSGFSKNADNQIVEFKQQPKLQALNELLEQNNSHQVVIWSRFVRDVKAIANLCKEKGITYGCLVGQDQGEYKAEENEQYANVDIPQNAYGRQKLIDEFEFGNIQIMIGTAQTGGLGINLVKAQTVIYYANDYSLLNRLQSEDRCHRSGQKNQVNYYDIIARDTVDIGILEILQKKKKVADIITRDNLKNLVEGKDV